MTEIYKVEIKRNDFPIDEYLFNAMIWKSIDGGATYWHAGYGKHCRTLAEAEEYKREIESRNEVTE